MVQVEHRTGLITPCYMSVLLTSAVVVVVDEAAAVASDDEADCCSPVKEEVPSPEAAAVVVVVVAVSDEAVQWSCGLAVVGCRVVVEGEVRGAREVGRRGHEATTAIDHDD